MHFGRFDTNHFSSFIPNRIPHLFCNFYAEVCLEPTGMSPRRLMEYSAQKLVVVTLFFPAKYWIWLGKNRSVADSYSFNDGKRRGYTQCDVTRGLSTVLNKKVRLRKRGLYRKRRTTNPYFMLTFLKIIIVF